MCFVLGGLLLLVAVAVVVFREGEAESSARMEARRSASE